MVSTTDSPHHPNADLQEATTNHDSALAAIRPVNDALSLIPTLCNEVRELRRRLALALADLSDLVAAGKAALGAYADGEPDPFYYVRDELEAQGHIHPETKRTRSQERP